MDHLKSSTIDYNRYGSSKITYNRSDNLKLDD